MYPYNKMRNPLLWKVPNPLLWRLRLPSLPKFRVSLPKQRMHEWITWWIVLCGIVASVAAFFYFVDPALKGETNLRIGADSAFYLWAAGLRPDNPYGTDFEPTRGIIELSSNLLGPLLIAVSLRNNFLILCFDYLLLFGTVWCFASSRPINASLFVFLLLLNPAILVSILTVNKEILAIFSTALFCYYLARGRKSKLLLAGIVLVSLLARWEHLLVVILFLLVTRGGFFNRHRALTLIGVIAGISIIYPILAATSAYIAAFQPEDLTGNTIVRLTGWQSKGLYFAAVIPKIALNLYAGFLSSVRQDPTDIYNRFVVPWASILNLVVTAWFLLRRKFRLSDDMLYFAALYAVLMAVSPFASLRYSLPVYVILCYSVTSLKAHDSRRAQTTYPSSALVSPSS